MGKESVKIIANNMIILLKIRSKPVLNWWEQK